MGASRAPAPYYAPGATAAPGARIGRSTSLPPLVSALYPAWRAYSMCASLRGTGALDLALAAALASVEISQDQRCILHPSACATVQVCAKPIVP